MFLHCQISWKGKRKNGGYYDPWDRLLVAVLAVSVLIWLFAVENCWLLPGGPFCSSIFINKDLLEPVALQPVAAWIVSVKAAVPTSSTSASVVLLTVLGLILIIMGACADGAKTAEQGAVPSVSKNQIIAIKSKQILVVHPQRWHAEHLMIRLVFLETSALLWWEGAGACHSLHWWDHL